MPYHVLPPNAHGNRLPVSKIAEKYDGKGDARHVIGAEITVLLPFDNLAPVPIVIEGLDVAALPSAETVNEHNMKLDLLIGDFQGLVIEFAGGDFGAIRYRGRATGVSFPSLAPASGNK